MTGFKKLAFLWSYSLVAVILFSYYLFGGGYWTFAGLIYAYGIIPILDEIVGRDPNNVTHDQFEQLTQDIYFDILVYSMVYLQWGVLIWAGYVLTFDGLNSLQMVGLLLSIGVFNSGGINIGHELGHRKSLLAQWHSQAILMTVSYMHFFIEHNKGHHVHVATPLDPATSHKNQTVYSFWIQSIIGGWFSAWNIEKQRLERASQKVWSFRNAMIWYVILPIVLCLVLTLAYGSQSITMYWLMPVFFVMQSIIAFCSLECVNYIEHYGIVRREIAPNKYERVNPLHSWNANHFVSNLVLFQLQRHSDHHAFAARPYQVLRHFDESPQLPFGYPVMIILSMIPPLWFKVMNKRLEDWQAKAYDAEHINQVVKVFA
ncbi:MAG: alkane 1-monooxygenase [Cytophagales bacterium]|nr:MAG: alkane 1-monooxygenase [Cytophagales bacterium]